MNIRNTRQQLANIDKRLAVLDPHITKLTHARQRYLLDGSEESLSAIAIIEKGVRPGQGRPADLDLDVGMPGLYAAQHEAAQLSERRELLLQQLPSPREVEAATVRATEQAAAIDKYAEALDKKTTALQVALGKAAELALVVADESWHLFVANRTLDTECSEADIPRPATPHRDAMVLPAAIPFMELLRYFTGDPPAPVDPQLWRAVLAAQTHVSRESVTAAQTPEMTHGSSRQN